MATSKPGKWSEFERIRWMTALIEEVNSRACLGPGDDAAAWKPPAGHTVVMTVDVQLEDIHFRRQWLSPGSIGRRALAAAVSDLASMAAAPAGVLLSLTLPDDVNERSFRALFRGLLQEAKRYRLDIFGGNLSRGPLGISTTAIGHAPKSRLVYRRGARAGDVLYVTGWPGRSRLGRELLSRKNRSRSAACHACLEAFKHPSARIDAAQELVKRVRLQSMIDISDGLAADLGHILEESRKPRHGHSKNTQPVLGAILEREALVGLLDTPIPRRRRSAVRQRRAVARDACIRLCDSLDLDPLEVVLEGGEDFELLFTTRPRHAPDIDRCAVDLGLPITRLGNIVADRSGIAIVEVDGRVRTPRTRGYDHFE